MMETDLHKLNEGKLCKVFASESALGIGKLSNLQTVFLLTRFLE